MDRVASEIASGLTQGSIHSLEKCGDIAYTLFKMHLVYTSIAYGQQQNTILSKAVKLHMVLFCKMDIFSFYHRRDANGPFFCYEY